MLVALFLSCSDSTSVDSELQAYVDDLSALGVDFSGVKVVARDIDGINGRCSRARGFGNDTIIINLRQLKSTPVRSIHLTLLHEAVHCIGGFRGHEVSSYFNDGCKARVISANDPDDSASNTCWETHKLKYMEQYFEHLGG